MLLGSVSAGGTPAKCTPKRANTARLIVKTSTSNKVNLKKLPCLLTHVQYV